jgi:hypothetical protein
MNDLATEKGLASIKGMPVKKAASFVPDEIKGNNPNVKLSHDGQGLESVLAVGKANQ